MKKYNKIYYKIVNKKCGWNNSRVALKQSGKYNKIHYKNQ